MTTKKTFQVLYGDPILPHSEWEIVNTNLDDPVYTQEMHVRRRNWDNEYFGKQYPNDPDYKMRYVMRQTPPDQDYVTRMREREERGEFTPFGYGNGNSRYPMYHPETGKISYFASLSDALKDKRTETNLPRFIRKYVTASEYSVRDICERYGFDYNKGQTLKFATTVEEVQEVYKHGPSSCMSGTHHPEVGGYAVAPVAVAYMVYDDEEGFHPFARAVVNMDTKQWVSIYGADAQMSAALEKEGYRQNSYALRGCRLLKLRDDTGDELYPPYLDGGHRAFSDEDEPDKYWKLA